MGIEELLLDMAEKKGMSKKEMEKNIAFTKNLLMSSDFNFIAAKIAELVGVSEAFVLDVKKDLNL